MFKIEILDLLPITFEKIFKKMVRNSLRLFINIINSIGIYKIKF